MSIDETVSVGHKPMDSQPQQNATNPNPSEATNDYLSFLQELLKVMKKENASDLFITVGCPPSLKINGSIEQISNCCNLTPDQAAHITAISMTKTQKQEFFANNECNYAISFENIGRFRVNAFRQRGNVGMVIRLINTEIPLLEDLKVPNKLKDLVMEKRGLILVVGATSSGKSTTLAGMIGYRNKHQAGHIVTIEDPIEFIHKHEKSIITQREVGVDTENFETALKNSLSQAPDVIFIGEIRDQETMEYAVTFAETGHLCLATLHANNANQALDRIINFFPEQRKEQLLMDLSLNLRGVVSQRLIPAVKGGRVAAVEVLLNSPRMTELIKSGQISEMKEVMKNSRQIGMQTFDQALFDLYESNLINFDDALRNSDSSHDLNLDIKLNSKRAASNVKVNNNKNKYELQDL